ncbi:MAG TPA: helix-turn-helix domain-containing protein [Steroidobacteraceae bacterium]|nr:helix-turn-helix domain-containing protein [Steroidobacteraceae bacterium]
MTREEGGVGIGARLRAARERRGLTVLQAAERLHVDARLLEGLEVGNFEPLGAAVYVRGHLRRYAELIGESPAELLDLYVNVTPAVRPDLTRIPRGEPAPQSARLLLPALMGVVALALAGLLWWLLNLPHARPHPLAAPIAVAPAPPAAAAQALAGAATDAPPAAPAAPVPVAPPERARAGEQTVTLKFTGPSWVQVADAHDKVLLDGLQVPGAARSVSGAAPLRVVLGNAAAVALEVNGRPASLEGLVRRRGDAHVSIAADGSVSATAPSGRGE